LREVVARRLWMDGWKGAGMVVCARVPMLIAVRDSGWLPGRRHDGDPLGLWRASTRTWRQQGAGSWPRCIG
jgi:hypothetical protein